MAADNSGQQSQAFTRPASMKAAVTATYGPPEVAKITDVPVPAPGRKELLVRVHASTVNRTDCAYRSGSPWIARLVFGLFRPKATILGCEFAGRVAEVGDGATAFAVGDRIFGYVEGQKSGGHAEYLAVSEDAAIAKIPNGVGYDVAAAATEGSHYAMAFLHYGGIERGTKVLVNGATGGIGSAGVQLCVDAGADVTAVCGTPHLDLVSGFGASKVIDYTAHDFTQDDVTYDAVLDMVGKSTFGRCRRILGPSGVYISSELGPKWQNPLLALLTPMLGGRKVKFPLPNHDKKMIEKLGDMMESGKFKPLIDRRMPLEDIVEAYRYAETGEKIGNVIIIMAEDSDKQETTETPE